ncbi:unnamed protein product [Adineta ricciae]|uniref:Uncharacterized protein n=1 Tax=Adineta ricciae TaxID=249248 RepID=A0A816EWS9_ADIRI|nr:unnamed protein product [Adineta ricciae]
MTISTTIMATVIQFYSILNESMALDLSHQIVNHGFLRIIQYYHRQTRIPPIAILKLYPRSFPLGRNRLVPHISLPPDSGRISTGFYRQIPTGSRQKRRQLRTSWTRSPSGTS